MKKKMFLTWLLVMILAVGSLAACGSKQEPAPAPADTTTTEDTTATDSTAAPEQTEQAAPADSSEITADKAKEIALADAGVDAANAVFKKAELDFDDGVQKYDVEFFANDTEFSYDIDAKSGSIIEKESEAMDAEDYQEMETLKQ